MAIKKSSGSGIPFGNNAGRPAVPGIGQLYSNGQEKRLELYTSSGWQNIVSETPGVVSVSGNYLESAGSGTLEITGTNFSTGAIASVIGTNGVEINANSTTVNSIVSISAVFTGLVGANEPYDLKVTNTSNLFGLLPDAIYVNNILNWQTASGSLGTFAEQVSMSVSATATDDSIITYSLASGSTLPSGITLNSSTGVISGTLPDIATNTTYTFTINASDGSNPAVPRTFSFISNAAPIWSTSAGSLGTFSENTSINITVAATDASDSITYALASGSTLPSGISLNSSTGVISGTLPDIGVDTLYSFTINAVDGINTIARAFSINSLAQTIIETLVVGGGGAGGTNAGAGGGAGGYYSNLSTVINRSIPYTITVGNGAIAATDSQVNGANSIISGSLFTTITALGGGGGVNSNGSGNNGGSGGGSSVSFPVTSATQPSSPSGGLGNPGGIGNGGDGAGRSGAGGGGAGGVGQNTPSNSQGGAGGVGVQSSITGTAIFYAGGGGGAPHLGSPGAGGNGGGGSGGNGGYNTNSSTAGVAGTPNTGGGGGAGGGGGFIGGNGGSGVVIIAYPDTIPPITTIAGTLTYNQPSRAGYRVYRFTAGSGTITF